jgi:hypothetical protein
VQGSVLSMNSETMPTAQSLCREKPEVHAILQWVAAAVFDRLELSIEITGNDHVDLQPALANGDLTIASDGRVAFSDTGLQLQYLIRHAAEIAAREWQDLERFAQVFADIQHRAIRLEGAVARVFARAQGLSREIAAGTLLLLAREYGKDVVEQMRVASVQQLLSPQRNDLFWNLYQPFCTALPDLGIVPSALPAALDPMLRAVANDMTSHLIYEAVETLASRDRGTAESLYVTFVESDQPTVNSLTANALVALSRFDLKASHRMAMALTDRRERLWQRVGLESLSRLQYLPEDTLLLRATLDRLSAFRVLSSPEIDDVLVVAYGRLVDLVPEAGEALADMAARPITPAHSNMALVLLKRRNQHSAKNWYRRALDLLARIESSNTVALGHLDYCLQLIAVGDPAFAVAFLEQFVCSRDYSQQGREMRLPRVLRETCQVLREQHTAILEATLTGWLASSEPRLHSAARDVIEEGHESAERESPSFLRLSKPVLDELPGDTVRHLLARAMGHLVYGKTLAVLLLSGLRREPLPESLSTLVTEALSDYVLYNYPGTRDLLMAQAADPGALSVERQVVEAALAASHNYYEALTLPKLNELRPPAHRVALLRQAKQKQIAAATERGREQSPLLQILHRVPIRFSHSFFTEVDGNLSEPAPMTSFSFSVDFPRGALIDPLGQAERRHYWRSVGLKGTPEDGTAEPAP